MRRQRLTPEIEHRILAHIRNGGFAHVAAEAAGIPRGCFGDWLKLGKRRRARPPYRRFWLGVLQARAQSRLAAEIEIRKNDLKFWLRYGPGKNAAPGWGPAGKGSTRTATPAQSDEDLYHLCVRMTQALMPYPEARLAVLPVMEAVGVRPGAKRAPPATDRNGA
jgi:hypothetical protein